ncbi:CD83 molecule [Turdus rufiventris]|nr:CD83 molecule [Turdus rufiventris]
MSLGLGALLLILCNVWCLICGTSVMIPDVAVRCAEEAVLPCKALQDSSISYQTASWYKLGYEDELCKFNQMSSRYVENFKREGMAGDSEGIAWEVLDVESHYPQEAGGSLELSNDTFSLRIKNATSQTSGTYRCTLEGQNGERNLTSTVTLKVTGCPGTGEDKLKKYKSELFMLTCLGIFYLLLIFFTCFRMAWFLVAGGVTKMGPVGSCWKLPPCPAEPILDGSEDGHAVGHNWAHKGGWDSSKPILRTMKCLYITVSAQDKQMICVGLLGGHLVPKKK